MSALVRQLKLPGRPLRAYSVENKYDREFLARNDFRPLLLCRTVNGVRELIWDRSQMFSNRDGHRSWCADPRLQKQAVVMIREGAFPELGHGEEVRVSRAYFAILNLLDDAAWDHQQAVDVIRDPRVEALQLAFFYPVAQVKVLA